MSCYYRYNKVLYTYLEFCGAGATTTLHLISTSFFPDMTFIICIGIMLINQKNPNSSILAKLVEEGRRGGSLFLAHFLQSFSVATASNPLCSLSSFHFLNLHLSHPPSFLPSFIPLLEKRFQKQRRMSFCTSNNKGFLYPSNNLPLFFPLSLSLSLSMFAILYTPYLYFHI